MKKFLLVVCLVALQWADVYSQQYYFQEISISEGLANKKIYTVFEDVDHFIWMGNSFGVSVFDGSQIINYSPKDGLAKGGVKSIYQDRFQNIFFGNYDGGISKYKDRVFESIDSTGIDGNIYKITESGDFLWFVTNGSGAYRFPLSKTKDGWDFDNPEIFIGKDGLSDRVYDIIELSTGELILVSDVGLKEFNSSTKEFKAYKKDIIPAYFAITTIFEASDGIIYIGTHNGGLYVLNPNDDKIVFYDEKSGLSHNFIMSIDEDKQGSIWIGTFGGGINMLNSGEIEQFNSKNGFSEKRIQSLLINYQGLLLVGTDASGLQIFKGFQFLNFTSIPKFESTTVFDLEFVNGNLYEATEKGLLKLSFKDKASFEIESLEVLLEEPIFNYIESDGKDGLWLASEMDEVWHYNLKDRSYYNVLALRPYFMVNKITSFSRDEMNRLWIGTINGLLLYDPSTDTVERLSQENGILKNSISCVSNEGNKTWVGSRQSD